MTIDDNFLITTDHYDYGIPVIFELAPENPEISLVGDEIRLVFESDVIERRHKLIETDDDTTLSFALTKEEADNIFNGELVERLLIPYSLKRYREGQYLDTLVNSNLKIVGTVKW